MNRRAVALMVLMWLALASVAAVPAAADHNTAATNASAQEPEHNAEPITDRSEETESEHSIDELREGGRLISGAAPSKRWLGYEGSVYLDYANPNPLVGGGAEDWEAGEILQPGQTLKTDSLTLNAQRQRDAQAAEYDMVVVYWTTDRRGNETVLTNVTTQRQSISMSGPVDQSEISLRRSDDPRQVTMWLEDSSGNEVSGARWTFEHQSVATTRSAGIDSMGDLFGWVGKWIVMPLIGLTMISGLGTRAAIKRAGTGPDKGLVYWSIMGTAATITIVAAAWFLLADWLVALPLVIPVGLAVFMSIVILETYETGVEEVEFIKPELSLGESPSGEKSVDMLEVESTTEKVVRSMPGDLAVVRSGIRPFFSRIFGGAAPLEGASTLSTRINVDYDGDRSDHDHDAKVFVHPRSVDVLDYEPEGWALDMPAPSNRSEWMRLGVTVGLALIFSTAVAVTYGMMVGTIALLTVTAVIGLRPKQGYAKVDVATAHTREAFTSMMYLAREIDNADTISEARRKLVEKEARSEKDVEEALTDRDSTLVSEMFNTNTSEAVDSLNGSDELDDLLEDARDREEDSDDREVLPADD